MYNEYGVMLFMTLCCSLSGKSSECEDTVYSDLKQNTDRGERNTHIISPFKRDITITVQMMHAECAKYS